MPFLVTSTSPAVIPIAVWKEYCEARGITNEMLATLPNSGFYDIDTAAKLPEIGPTLWGVKRLGAHSAFVFESHPGYLQARVFYDPQFFIPKPGEAVRKVEKQPKYIKSRGAPNTLFFPPIISDWYTEEYDLIIVEGALNAARLARDGFHAVGLFGVNNYRVGSKETPIIPDLIRIITSPNVKRVIVMYDSDVMDLESKTQLYVSFHTLMRDLLKIMRATPEKLCYCFPPNREDGSKMGADDFLHKEGIDAFRRLIREHAKQYEDEPFLQVERKAVERFILDELSGKLWDCNNRQLIDADHANRILTTFGVVLDPFSKTPRPITYNTARLLAAPGLRVAQGLKYRPDVDDVYYQGLDSPPLFFINKFHPNDVPQAIKGDVSIAMEMLQSICRDSPSAIQKILIIAAWHAQNPARVPKYAILLEGEQRAGKSNFARLIGTSLSKRFHSARIEKLDDYNSTWRGYACKEWPEFHRDMDEEWLKDLITSETVFVNAKYGGQWTEDNFTLNIFTCNGLKSKIQSGDKRFVMGGSAKADNIRLGLEFEKWVRGPGPNYFRHFLLNEVDCTEYDTLDVNTEIRADIINASKSNYESIVDEVIEHLSEVEGLEVVPSGVLISILEQYMHPNQVLTFLKANSRIFAKTVRENYTINGKSTRFRIFKNHERWKKEIATDPYQAQALLAAKLTPERKY